MTKPDPTASFGFRDVPEAEKEGHGARGLLVCGGAL